MVEKPDGSREMIWMDNGLSIDFVNHYFIRELNNDGFLVFESRNVTMPPNIYYVKRSDMEGLSKAHDSL